MTRGIGFQPKVQLKFTSPTTGEQVEPIAPGQVQAHLMMHSEKRLIATFTEKLNFAWLAVLKMLHGPIFNTWGNQQQQKKALAIDVLTRLNNVPVEFPDGSVEKLGDLVENWLQKNGVELSFEDKWKECIETRALQEIAKEVSNLHYAQDEQKLLDFVQKNGFAIDPINPKDHDLHEFVRCYVNAAADHAENAESSSYQLDSVLENVARILKQLDFTITNQETAAEYRADILRRITINCPFKDFLETCRSDNGPKFIVDEAVGAINRIKGHIKPIVDEPSSYGYVAHPTWETY
jgi:hypothetical protein